MRDAVCHEGAVAPRLGLRTPTYLPRKPAGQSGAVKGFATEWGVSLGDFLVEPCQ